MDTTHHVAPEAHSSSRRTRSIPHRDQQKDECGAHRLPAPHSSSLRELPYRDSFGHKRLVALLVHFHPASTTICGRSDPGVHLASEQPLISTAMHGDEVVLFGDLSATVASHVSPYFFKEPSGFQFSGISSGRPSSRALLMIHFLMSS